MCGNCPFQPVCTHIHLRCPKLRPLRMLVPHAELCTNEPLAHHPLPLEKLLISCRKMIWSPAIYLGISMLHSQLGPLCSLKLETHKMQIQSTILKNMLSRSLSAETAETPKPFFRWYSFPICCGTKTGEVIGGPRKFFRYSKPVHRLTWGVSIFSHSTS